jgi:hypothetical protein
MGRLEVSDAGPAVRPGDGARGGSDTQAVIREDEEGIVLVASDDDARDPYSRGWQQRAEWRRRWESRQPRHHPGAASASRNRSRDRTGERGRRDRSRSRDRSADNTRDHSVGATSND